MDDEQITETLATQLLGWRPTPPESPVRRWQKPDGAHVWRRDFAPLTDARACALVKAECVRQGWEYTISLMDDTYYCSFGHTMGASADTEERALCVAALRAVGVET